MDTASASNMNIEPTTTDLNIDFFSVLNNIQHRIDTRSEMHRLASLKKWNDNPSRSISRVMLAKFGFSYVEEERVVKCSGCGLRIESGTVDFNPRDDHMRLSPNCPFILNNTYLAAIQNTEINTPKALGLENTIDFSFDDDIVVTDGISSAQQMKFFSAGSNETISTLRMNTFSNWPLITPSAEQMAKAGFYYTNIADRVICLHCHVIFHRWSKNDQPLEIHSLISPRCSFISSFQERPDSSAYQRIQISTEPPTQVLTNPMHKAFAETPNRLKSFDTWPHSEANPLPAPQALVTAGFFYDGKDAAVRCFYCNGALRNWQANDDPKIEHARWFPHCPYIRQLIGEDLYVAIQRKNRQLLAEKNGFGSAANAWSREERDRMVKARLDLPQIVQLRSNGYDFSVIRKVIDMQLQFKKDDFKTTDDLCIAYFILEQQVTLIKGNESRISSPADWLKSFHEKTQNGEVTSPTSLVTNQDSPAEKKISPISSPQQKDDDDDKNLCTICFESARRVACMPCGHFCTCVTCGHSLRSCPMCRSPVKSLVRIYL